MENKNIKGREREMAQKAYCRSGFDNRKLCAIAHNFKGGANILDYISVIILPEFCR